MRTGSNFSTKAGREHEKSNLIHLRAGMDRFLSAIASVRLDPTTNLTITPFVNFLFPFLLFGWLSYSFFSLPVLDFFSVPLVSLWPLRVFERLDFCLIASVPRHFASWADDNLAYRV